jgi:hypothetical protein
MRSDYQCLSCRNGFTIEVGKAEMDASLARPRPDTCPDCGQRVGTGPAKCRNCGHVFPLEFPHWHVRCDLASGRCPHCEGPYVSPCIC